MIEAYSYLCKPNGMQIESRRRFRILRSCDQDGLVFSSLGHVYCIPLITVFNFLTYLNLLSDFILL